MNETPLYFGREEEPLFGVFHAPGRAPTGLGVVFCHPFGEEKLWSHRVFVSYARELTELGHAVLRFDYRGNGDSGGDFSRSSLTTALADVRSAVDHLRSLSGSARVSLVGLRLGATIAALVADEMADLDRLVLWSPVVNGAGYMQELLRINLTTQLANYKEIRQDRDALAAAMERGEAVNVDGYEMTYPMYSEVSGVRLAAGPHAYQGPCLIVQVDRQERPSPELQQLAGCYGSATLAFAQEDPFWKEISRFYQRAPNLFARTTEWLDPR
ncbi:MAG: alpha/beta fold hydrolase [Acidobacteria bacterium]|nr:alpha/beta fold hydrolase [Acidobacteriota bacterium]